jgi:hypothetical protein
MNERVTAFPLAVRQFSGRWRLADKGARFDVPVVGYRPLEGGPLGFLTLRRDRGTVVADEWREYRIARFVFVTAGFCADCGQYFGVITAQHRPLLFTAEEVASKPEWTAREALPGELAQGIPYHSLKQAGQA